MILLDTSVLIELFRKKNKDRTLFFEIAQKNQDLCISAITHYEVSIGNRASHAEYWAELEKCLHVMPFDRSCSIAAANIYHDLLRRNRIIDLADLLIGATAISQDVTIATLNVKHFERIEGLKLYQP